jgi:lipid-binding SYLF domain-containing protein
VLARTKNGWSGPAFIGTGGAGFGPQIGAEVNEVVLILNSDAAVKAFSRGGNVKLGGDVSIAAGPVGRDVAAGGIAAPVAAVYSYSRSEGLFVGASLNGTVIVSRPGANAAYYGHSVAVRSILSGRVPAPAGSTRLVASL